MCQCVLCDCCWWNFCGVCCAGYHIAYCCVSCWMCKPPEMTNQECCECGTCTGYGGNFFCEGMLLFAPDFVIQYSQLMNNKNRAPTQPGTATQFKWLLQFHHFVRIHPLITLFINYLLIKLMLLPITEKLG